MRFEREATPKPIDPETHVRRWALERGEDPDEAWRAAKEIDQRESEQ